jgi:branched-chain amino acid transport system permease protein
MNETKKKNTSFKFDWQGVLRYGLLAGIVLLYVGVIGMVETFNEREVIYTVLTLGQLLMLFPAFVAAYVYASRTMKDSSVSAQSVLGVVGGGVLIGLLAALPTIIMIFISTPLDVRSILVNVNRNWLEVVTYDNRDNLVNGSMLLMLNNLGAALVGSVIVLLPERIRRAVVVALSFSLVVGVMGETVRTILEQLIPQDAVDTIFRRRTLRLEAAIGIGVLAAISSLFWTQIRSRAATTVEKMPAQQQSMVRYVQYGLLLGVLLVLPFLIGRALSDVMVTVGLYVLMGFGLNIAIGLAGLLDLGYVTNYAVGAYITAVLTSTGALGIASTTGLDFFNFWIVIPIALLAAMLTGFIFAVPVLKMRGDYLAIATLGFGEIIYTLAVSDWFRPIIGGAQGIREIPNAMFFGTEIKNPEQLYYVVLVACILTLIVSIRLNNSRTGRQWMAIREDEDVAAAMGIDVARAKLLAFTISAATGGVAGAIFVIKVLTVFPNSFTVFVSINVLSLIIVGGMGSNPGIVLGSLVLVGMPELLREFSEYRWLMYGVLLIFMMIRRPEGLLPSKIRQRELATTESSAPAAAGD